MSILTEPTAGIKINNSKSFYAYDFNCRYYHGSMFVENEEIECELDFLSLIDLNNIININKLMYHEYTDKVAFVLNNIKESIIRRTIEKDLDPFSINKVFRYSIYIKMKASDLDSTEPQELEDEEFVE